MSMTLDNIDLNNCRRERSDRRQVNKRNIFYSLFMKQRAGERRLGYSNDNTYVDLHGPYVSAAAIVVMILTILDAFFTLLLIERGSSELNPFLALMLDINTIWFYTSKYLITAVCVLWIVMHNHFTFFGFKGKYILTWTIAGYGVLITYQLSMLTNII